MDCRNVGDATKMATELYREAIHVPFMAKYGTRMTFTVFNLSQAIYQT